MCKFFGDAESIPYRQRLRSVRIHGVLTSIRLENMVWDVLGEMAAGQGLTTNAQIVAFHDQILANPGKVPNFASFLRVTCLRYLQRRVLKAEQDAAAVVLLHADVPTVPASSELLPPAPLARSA